MIRQSAVDSLVTRAGDRPAPLDRRDFEPEDAPVSPTPPRSFTTPPEMKMTGSRDAGELATRSDLGSRLAEVRGGRPVRRPRPVENSTPGLPGDSGPAPFPPRTGTVRPVFGVSAGTGHLEVLMARLEASARLLINLPGLSHLRCDLHLAGFPGLSVDLVDRSGSLLVTLILADPAKKPELEEYLPDLRRHLSNAGLRVDGVRLLLRDPLSHDDLRRNRGTVDDESGSEDLDRETR